MSKKLVFANDGLLDPRSITTFGVSAKESANAIGFFGTGFKYAIAILLREGCEITVQSGEKVYVFAARKMKIRGTSFAVVTMNGKSLSFTTELGKTWKLWQAIREIYCNCIDEPNAAIYEAEDDQATFPLGNQTIITVTGEKVMAEWSKREDFILTSKPFEIINSIVEIHAGASKFVYYKGIRVLEMDEPSQFTYNILRKTELTEDRTMKYSWEVRQIIREVAMKTIDSRVIEKLVIAPEGYAEHKMNMEGVLPSEKFLEVVARFAKERKPGLNQSALHVCRTFAMERLQDSDEDFINLNTVDTMRLVKAIQFCRFLEFNVDEYPIKVSEYLGDSILGLADRSKQTIYLSRRVFTLGSSFLASTLIEEFLHLKHNLNDCDRNMQNFLFETIVALGERLKGEPL